MKLEMVYKQLPLVPTINIIKLLGTVDHRKGTVYEDIYKELEAIAMKDERLLDAFTQWQELSLSDEQYHAYEGRLKRILDEEAAVIEAKLREEEALEKGKSIEKRNTVIRLAQLQLPIEQIATATELSVIEVKKILKEADISQG